MSLDSHGNIHRKAGVPGAGQFAGRANAAPAAALSEPAVPTVANTRVTLLIDGVPRAVREPASGGITLLGENPPKVTIVGDTLSMLGAGADGSAGGWALHAEVVDDAGDAVATVDIPCPAFGSLLVAEHDGQFMLVDDLDAAGVSLADPRVSWHTDELLNLLPDERVDLHDVRSWLEESPGDGPFLVDAALNNDDTSLVDVDVCVTDNLTWSSEFTEEELDEHRDIVEAVYREWFDADIQVDETWETFDVTLRTQVESARASRLLILERTHNSYAKFRNETDPGTFGSPYVGSEIRRRIDERKAASNSGTQSEQQVMEERR